MLLLAAQNENSLSQPRLASSDSPIPRFPNSPILRLLLKKQNQKTENKSEKAKHLFQLEQLNKIFVRV